MFNFRTKYQIILLENNSQTEKNILIDLMTYFIIKASYLEFISKLQQTI